MCLSCFLSVSCLFFITCYTSWKQQHLLQEWDHKQKITDSLSAQFNRPADDLLLMISTQIRTEPRVQKSINGSDILVLMGCWKLPRLIISFLLKHQNNYFTHNSQSFLVVVIFVSEAVRKEHFLRTGWNPFLSHSCDAERSPISGLWTFLFFIA